MKLEKFNLPQEQDRKMGWQDAHDYWLSIDMPQIRPETIRDPCNRAAGRPLLLALSPIANVAPSTMTTMLNP